MTAKIPPWSYSSLVDFEGCPRRYKLIRIDKVVPFKETEAIKHGNEVHKALEDYMMAATARTHRCLLWTHNRKHYPMDDIELLAA